MAPVIRASSVMLLLAAALFVAPAFAATEAEIAGVQAACNSSFGIPYPGDDTKVSTQVLQASACRACMSAVGHSTDDSEMYACSSVCQNPALYPSSGDTSQLASDCSTCIQDPVATAYGCQACMQYNMNNKAAYEGCFSCIKNASFAGKPAHDWACSQCYTFMGVDDTAFKQCTACISGLSATLAPGETVPRDTDYGKCVFDANQTYLLNHGMLDLNGTVYAACYPADVAPANYGTLPLSPSDCVTCMRKAESLFTGAPQYPNITKDWACASYCQNPKYTGTGTAGATLANQCVTCVEAATPKDPWACSTCMQTTNPTACFGCVAADPYGGNISSYNWACSMCAKVEDSTLRDMCFQCIKTQPGSTLAPGTKIDEFTESNICSCVDLTQNRSIHVNRTLDAVERSCFSPFISHNASGDEVISAIPWGIKVVGNTTACLQCMAAADVTSPPYFNKRFACNQYCQDPNLVSGADAETQGNDCAVCVSDKAVKDPWGCQACMTATSDTALRRDCYTCVRGDSGKYPNHAWGCSQCATFTNSSERAACYQCLSTELTDPCACVDGVKNGTITLPAPPTQSATPICEHGFAALSCNYPQVIINVSVFYGRLDSTTCVTSDGSCALDPSYPQHCPVTDTSCSATGATTKAMATIASCVGRDTCNLFSGSPGLPKNYSLPAENAIFTDPCEGTYKYMTYNLHCGPPSELPPGTPYTRRA